MPTTPVKVTSGPPETQRTERTLLVLIQRFARLVSHNFYRSPSALSLISCALLLGLGGASNAAAQTLNVRIELKSVSPARLRIELALPYPTNMLSFRNTYAGVIGLGERIESLAAINGAGDSIPVQKLAPGEFKSSEKFSRFNYEVNLGPPTRPSQMSHVTWLLRDQGLLMLSDLLPQRNRDSVEFASALVSVEVPPGWSVASNIRREGSQFSTNDPETAVFLVGTAVQERHQRIASTDFAVITAGEWPFSNKDVFPIAGKIMKEHLRVTGFRLRGNAVLMLVPYPGGAGPENWSAETRGNDVVIVLGREASGRKVLARLGIVLSHELFHLWVPNSLVLKGDYDWFFEGFTLYQALRTDLQLGLISFADYLETIARVYDSYQSSQDADRLSLIEASERRWTTSSSLVYEKGMLVAFIYDLMLQSRTNCAASLDGVYADLFRLPGTRQQSANETIIKILSERDGLNSFVRDHIETAGRINLDATLSSYGMKLQEETGGTGPTRLVVLPELTKAHQRLLGCIGYKK